MKPITRGVISLLLLVVAACPLLKAQDLPLEALYKDGRLSFQNRRHGVRVTWKNDVYFDVGGFVPLFNSDQITCADGSDIKLPGSAKFPLMHTKLDLTYGEKFGGSFMLDISNHKILYKNMYVDYNPTKSSVLRFGNMKVPGPMSVNYDKYTLMNIGQPMGLSLASDRRLGIAYYHHTYRHYLALGLYSSNINSAISNGFGREPEFMVAGRGTWNVVRTPAQILLLGANAYWHRMQDGLVASKNIRGSLETSLNPQRFISATLPNLTSQLNYGLEAAYQYKKFLFTLEGLASSFFLKDYHTTPTFFGWNAQAAYMIFGKPRGYKVKTADFAGSPYLSRKGALEVGMRYSGLRMNHDHEDLTISGGFGTSTTLYANYWLNHYLRFAFNASYVDHGYCATGAGAYTAVDSYSSGIDYFILQGRVVVSF